MALHIPPTLARRWPNLCVALIAAALLLPMRVNAVEDQTGEQIYQQQCARCHGAQGEGMTEAVAAPLAGDLPLAELTRVIEQTMPEDAPETCVGVDAEKVALYVYDAFYSEAARIRNAPPRIEVARLTVRQYENAVADLIGSFTRSPVHDPRRGLRATYFKGRNLRRDRAVMERIDSQVIFDFGDLSPEPEKIDADEFAIRWEGTILAPETGDYEFFLHTTNGARLWINDLDRPLIDAWVRSGDESEHSATIRLLSGRAYALRLEFFKYQEPSAAISLEWRPPHQVREVIPERHLSPGEAPRVLVVETPFPPDDRSAGYERGSLISEAWDQATTYAALEVAAKVEERIRDLANVEDDATRSIKLQEFGVRFAERAFRRPLSAEERAFYVDQHFAEGTDPNVAVKKVVLLVLKSPRFLFHEIGTDALDGYDVAARLSFGLWDSLPDQQLWDAAANGQLQTLEQIAAQAERMVADPRADAKMISFLHQWLRLDHVTDLSKDEQLYPEFNESFESDLRTSLHLMLEDILRSDTCDFRQLLQADWLYLNGRLAATFGVPLAPNADFQKLAVDPQQRAGVLSHPYLLAGFAYRSTSSPIHRGVFVARSVLGRALKPPPEAFAPLPEELHPDLTTRERVQLQTQSESCQSCHAMINPLGFSLEHYDAIGRYRTEEKGRPIDATGSYRTATGDVVQFTGVREMANFLSSSEETHAAFVEQLFQYLAKQPVAAYGANRLDELRSSFVAADFHLRRLMVEVMKVSALQPRNSTGVTP